MKRDQRTKIFAPIKEKTFLILKETQIWDIVPKSFEMKKKKIKRLHKIERK